MKIKAPLNHSEVIFVNNNCVKDKFSTDTKFSDAFKIDESMLQGSTELYQLQAIDQELPNLFGSLQNLNANYALTNNFLNTMINQKQKDLYNSKGITAQQMRMLCEIDIIILRHYYILRKEIFKKHNQFVLRFQNNFSNTINAITYIKKRFQYQYQDKIATILCRLVDEVNKNQNEEYYNCRINDVQYIPNEFIELELKLKKQTIASLDCSDLYQVYQEIAKLILTYLI